MGSRRLVSALVCVVSLAGCGSPESSAPAAISELDSGARDELGIVRPGSPEPGRMAPDFALRSLEGEVIQLSDFRGQPVLLNFFASWCVPCMVEMPLIQEAHLQAEAKGYVVLGVAVQDSREAVRSLSESMGLSFPMVFDGDSSVGLAYEVLGPPATFVIDKTGKIVSSVSGVMAQDELESELKKLAS